MKRLTAVFVTGIIAAALGMPVAHAGLFDGALGGAILGNMVGGRKAARTGAIIGGVVGMANSSGQRKRQQQQQEEAERRRAEWEAQQQAEVERIEQQRAAAPVAAANETLIVETQKSLIRLGYEPGPLGQAGPELTGAVMLYQKSKGLLETGDVSQALLTHMLRNGG
ncbi:MAG: peptidoglycan-binding protein [Gammaproteobacteria bacterium]|nr:peptidoglycan-binding protein [Gammaproteobacteria bacterium]MDH4314074.1 peptidoglycan-binding protein [Gammaproteobacteria bacterium]MDH5213117.1 peptidoglycan-binding protein [Gammaproteobacteria bacterium]